MRYQSLSQSFFMSRIGSTGLGRLSSEARKEAYSPGDTSNLFDTDSDILSCVERYKV
jgi:hypothetical protein